jgi:hypothetical protein
MQSPGFTLESKKEGQGPRQAISPSSGNKSKTIEKENQFLLSLPFSFFILNK